MKKQLLALGLAAALTLGLTGCGGKTETGDSDAVQGSAEATDVNVGLIMGPPSMGLGWFIHENEEGNTFNHYNFEVAGVDYSAVSASLNQGDYDIATLPSNVAAILYNNEDMKEQVKVISIGNLGLLYVMTTDPSINTMEDLKGRTLYSIGEGGPPEYTFGYLLKEYGLTEDVNFSFRATPFEVLNLLQEEPNSIALLPQPFVGARPAGGQGLGCHEHRQRRPVRHHGDGGPHQVPGGTRTSGKGIPGHGEAVHGLLPGAFGRGRPVDR